MSLDAGGDQDGAPNRHAMGLFRGGQSSVEQSSFRKSVPKSTRRTSVGQQLVNSILQKKEKGRDEAHCCGRQGGPVETRCKHSLVL